MQNHRTGRTPVAEGDPDDGGARQGSGDSGPAEPGVRGARDRRGRGSRRPPWRAALAALPLLAFVPALYYSLTTPFALVDDYRELQFVEILDGPRQFFEWCRRTFLEPGIFRYRPIFVLRQAFAAKIFGAEPWLHHLSRWVLHFAAVFLFAAAFLCFSRRERKDERSPAPAAGVPPLLPLALLVHLWIFFPNVPAARLPVLEVETVFFLGLCNWAFALLLLPRSGATTAPPGPLRPTGAGAHGLFLLGALGLSLTKETNVAPLLWMLIAYGAFLAAEPASPSSRFFRGAPLVLMFLFMLSRVYAASESHGFRASPHHPSNLDAGQFMANLGSILRNVFLYDTSVVLSAAFAVLLAALLLVAAARIFRFRRLSRTARGEVLFVLFLLGQFFSLYFMLALWPVAAPRYWYVLVPLLTTLLAFGARFILSSLAGLPAALSRAAACALAAFVCFFIAVNYHNFLFQTAVQHSLRRAESDLRTAVTRLLDEGQRVQIRIKASGRAGSETPEVFNQLIRHYRDFQPRFLGKKYPKIYTDADALPADAPALEADRPRWVSLHADAPALEADQPRWVVSLYGSGGGPPYPWRVGGLRVVDLYGDSRFVDADTVTFVPKLDYRLLSWAGTVSGFLQRGAPRVLRDYGVHRPGDKWNYGWVLYRAPYDVDGHVAGVVSRLVAQAGEPVIRSHWDVHVGESGRTRLAYLVREACEPADTEADFFVDTGAAEGARHVAFNFGFWGVAAGGLCAAAVELPGHALDSLEVGQDDVWRASAAFR